MKIRREIGEKGQVVIPRDIRHFLGLKPGTTIVFEIQNNEVKIKPDKTGKEFIEDFLNVPKIKRGKKTIKEIILEQYDERFEKSINQKV